MPRSPLQKVLFDKEYYHRFYHNKDTCVRDAEAGSTLANFIFSYVKHLRLPVKRVLDVGCGLGEWKQHLANHYPKATYTGIEYSNYLCDNFGWQHGSAASFSARGTFDLVICQSVLQYLNNSEVRAAIANFAQHCRGALYVEIITKKDWEQHCDQRVTDGRIYLRSGEWYKKLLSEYFVSAGGGLFIVKLAPVVLYELEGN